MKRNIKIIISLILILTTASVLVFFANKKTKGSGQSIYGIYLGEVLKDNKVVAMVNGDPIYLSDIAMPYFSAAISYTKVKARLKDIINNPNTSAEIKNDAQKSLDSIPDPVKILDARINAVLLYQNLRKKGMAPSDSKINQNLKKMENLWNYNLTNYPNSDWSKFFKSFKKSIGIRNNDDILKYYKNLIITEEALKIYRSKMANSVPHFTEKQINEEMKSKNIPKQTAIINLRNDFLNKSLEELALKLRKTADIKIIDINSVKKLSNYFNFTQ